MSGIVTLGFEIIGTTNPAHPSELFLTNEGCVISSGIK